MRRRVRWEKTETTVRVYLPSRGLCREGAARRLKDLKIGGDAADQDGEADASAFRGPNALTSTRWL
jgi:hypothetical protein